MKLSLPEYLSKDLIKSQRLRLHVDWPLISCSPVDSAIGMYGRDHSLSHGLQLQGEVLPHHTQQPSQAVSKGLRNLK